MVNLPRPWVAKPQGQFLFNKPPIESQKPTPSFYPEGNTALQFDPPERSLIKIVDLGGGSGGSGGATAPSFGVGSPEGAVTGDPGKVYTNSAGELWVKETGTGNTGWVKFIG